MHWVFSSCRKWGLLTSCSKWELLIAVTSLVEHGLYSVWASVAVAYGLSCSKACGIFPDQGLNPCPLHWQVDT